MREEVVGDAAVPGISGLDEMARQHRAVRLEVIELRGMIDSCRATQRTDGYRHMLAVLVGRLRERLALHFEIEQERVYAARLLTPGTADEIAAFAAEHDRLVRVAGQLADLLRATNAPPDVVAKTMQWLDDLGRHEQAEDEFLARVAT
jgi:hypothetical protein